MSTRTAKVEDVATLLPRMRAFNAVEGICVDPQKLEAALRQLLGTPTLGSVLVAEVDREVVGYAVVTWGYDLEWAGPDAFLTELWVDEDHRGGGLGQRLLSGAIDRCKEHGAGALHLLVHGDNAPAIRLYETAGFTTTPRRFYSLPIR